MSNEESVKWRLGEQHEATDLDGLERHREALNAMINQGRQRVDIVSRDLDRRLFDQNEVIEGLRQLALGNRRCRVRLLVIDTGALVRREHRLMSLVKRLPSYFEVRGPGQDHKSFNAAFVVVDRTGCIYRPQGNLYVGEARFNDPVRSDELTRRFDKLWEAGTPDVSLRQMRI